MPERLGRATGCRKGVVPGADFQGLPTEGRGHGRDVDLQARLRRPEGGQRPVPEFLPAGQGRKRRDANARRTTGGGGFRVGISERPAEAKTQIGDREVDPVLGGSHSGVLVSAADRASKAILLRCVDRKTLDEAGSALVDMPGNLKAPPLTVTNGNSREFAGRARMA